MSHEKMITIIEFPSFLAQIGKSMTATERDEFIDFLAKKIQILVMKLPGRVALGKFDGAGKARVKKKI